jgi:hypothetical protein
MCQGLTMSKGDIYNTKQEALSELEDMQEARLAEGMDADEDFDVIEIVKNTQGKWIDTYGAPIHINEEE